MSFADLCGQTADFFNPQPQVDGFGDTRHLWSDTPDESVPCRLQAIMTATTHGTKDHDERDLSGSRWKIYFTPPTVAISTHTRVRVDGKMFEISSLYPVPHPRRGIDHYVAQLNTVNDTVNYAG